MTCAHEYINTVASSNFINIYNLYHKTILFIISVWEQVITTTKIVRSQFGLQPPPNITATAHIPGQTELDHIGVNVVHQMAPWGVIILL